jgi:hypothetical protein
LKEEREAEAKPKLTAISEDTIEEDKKVKKSDKSSSAKAKAGLKQIEAVKEKATSEKTVKNSKTDGKNIK